MNKTPPTPNEWLALGAGSFALAPADPRLIPVLWVLQGGLMLARRSALLHRVTAAELARIDYDPDTGRPPRGKFLASLPVGGDFANLRALPAPEAALTRQRAPQPRAERATGGFAAFLAAVGAAPDADTEAAGAARDVTPEADNTDEDSAWVAAANAPAVGAVLPIRELVHRLNTLVDDYPHIFIVGNSGGGKTILAELIAGTRPGKLVVLDQKRPKGWMGPKWGGLPYVARDKTTASYAPMVAALAAVVVELNRRYSSQDTATEPFEQLTVILDEAKNSVEECEELASYYRKIVSIGREVGVRLILISTTDRARKLGFDGEADSLDSFAWVTIGEAALKVRPDLLARGTERYYWAAASLYGSWVAFENEKAYNLVPQLRVNPARAWDGVSYNCQVGTAGADRAGNQHSETPSRADRVSWQHSSADRAGNQHSGTATRADRVSFQHSEAASGADRAGGQHSETATRADRVRNPHPFVPVSIWDHPSLTDNERQELVVLESASNRRSGDTAPLLLASRDRLLEGRVPAVDPLLAGLLKGADKISARAAAALENAEVSADNQADNEWKSDYPHKNTQNSPKNKGGSAAYSVAGRIPGKPDKSGGRLTPNQPAAW